jgi:hypothetical protein
VKRAVLVGLVVGFAAGIVLTTAAVMVTGSWYVYYIVGGASPAGDAGRAELRQAFSPTGTRCQPIAPNDQIWFKCPRVRFG